MSDLSYDIVQKLLRYEPETGKLFWLPRPIGMLAGVAAREVKRWNSRHAGSEISALNGYGYVQASIFDRNYLAHRLAWLLHTGAWPVDQIDHINGVKTDNRIANLREVSCAENNRNQRLYTNNSSGFIGVGWHKRDQKWVARITVNGALKHLGYFETLELAAAARAEASAKFGFHPNHGRDTGSSLPS